MALSLLLLRIIPCMILPRWKTSGSLLCPSAASQRGAALDDIYSSSSIVRNLPHSASRLELKQRQFMYRQQVVPILCSTTRQALSLYSGVAESKRTSLW
ncbi:hypothetical protein K456DRAFT_113797 [Colletotrichum gloeosporioides 23]|nr:hypothetical protein K456DRAFT_113797 [Colletotrichum gloeosporioides 23]